MKIDFYTKTVLTVIALCLLLNTAKEYELIPQAYASSAEKSDETKVKYPIPMDAFNTIDVRIVDINTYDELNVNLKSVDTSDELKVNLKSIDTQDELDINVDEIGGHWVSSGGPIPVRVE